MSRNYKGITEEQHRKLADATNQLRTELMACVGKFPKASKEAKHIMATINRLDSLKGDFANTMSNLPGVTGEAALATYYEGWRP